MLLSVLVLKPQKKEAADAETETTGSETETEKNETEEVKEEVKANIFDEFFDKYKSSCT